MEDKETIHKKIFELIDAYEKLNRKKLDNKLKFLISARVKLYRADKHLTQEQLAKELKISRLQVLRWENGQSQPSETMVKFLQGKGILPDLS